MIVGIDASNIRGGGGVTHLVELLRAADPLAHGFSQVVVWSGRTTLTQIEDRRWLRKVHEPSLDGNLVIRTAWQTVRLSRRATEAGCDVLFIPGGSYVGTFEPMATFHQNLTPFHWPELFRFGVSRWAGKMLILRLVQTLTFRRAEGLICLTRHAEDLVMRVVKRTAGEVVVIPHGVDLRFECSPREQQPISAYSSERPFRVLYVSIINVYKHQWHVADAIARLRAEGLPVVLDLVGPAYPPALRRLNATLDRLDPAREFVRYVGPVPYDELHQTYAAADLFVFASTCETFGQIITEAMRAGLPIASSNRTAMPELLGDAGVYFDPEQPGEIADAVRSLVLSPQLRAEKAAAAFVRSETFSWQRCAADTFKHLTGVATAAALTSGAPTVEPWRGPGEVRVAVDRWCATQPVGDQFMERPLSARLVWNYLRHIGPVAVARKIRSRLGERERNKKVAGIGAGRILDAPASSGLTPGQPIVFFAPNHSVDSPRISLDTRLVMPALPSARVTEFPLPEPLQALAGWSPFSGLPLDDLIVRRELERNAAHCGLDSTSVPARRIARSPRRQPPRATRGRRGVPTAVLFGFGSYAKTQIIPCVRRHLRLEAVHEIDPDQLAGGARLNLRLDTSPTPRTWERYDAWFIAGYHHTHAAIAARALLSGAYAVVEKPVVTTRADLDQLMALVTSGHRRLFACFQRRYSHLDAWARADLGVGAGDPVDMHCLVYEIPLPPLHWYNWPNSGSRLVSNGCHWLDYFMYVNAYSPVVSSQVQALRHADLVITVELANGANLSMSLTDRGSERLGVRDVIDLRARNVTVRMIDSGQYQAESTKKILRRRRVNPLESYGAMYDAICRRILQGADGDSIESLRSTTLMLTLEEELQAQLRGAPVRPGRSA